MHSFSKEPVDLVDQGGPRRFISGDDVVSAVEEDQTAVRDQSGKLAGLALGDSHVASGVKDQGRALDVGRCGRHVELCERIEEADDVLDGRGRALELVEGFPVLALLRTLPACRNQPKPHSGPKTSATSSARSRPSRTARSLRSSYRKWDSMIAEIPSKWRLSSSAVPLPVIAASSPPIK